VYNRSYDSLNFLLHFPIGAIINFSILGQNRRSHYRILTPNELGLYFPTPNYCAKFRQILFKIATVGGMTDTHTHIQTHRQTPAIL